MIGGWAPISGRELIQRRVSEGWQDDEILDELGRMLPLVVDPCGEIVYPGLRGQRRLEELIGEVRAAVPDADLRGEILRLHREGLGEKAIGKALHRSEATIQRVRTRFGLIPWPKD